MSKLPITAASGLGALLALLLLGPQAVHAADPLLPGAAGCSGCERPPAPGADLPQTPPAAASPARKFLLSDVRFTGAEVLSAARLRELAQPYLGRQVNLADLQALAASVQAEYRAGGYFLATALVPVQTVQAGVVEISVIEGRLGRVEVQVDPQAPIGAAQVARFLKPLLPGRAVNAPEYERAMLLLSDQPGSKVGSALQQGIETGTTDLSVDVLPGDRYQFTAEADNHGTRESGRYRAGGTVRWLSPLGLGDNLDARLLLSNSNALQFGRLAYEAPIGGDGWRAGAAVSQVRYELGGQFAALGALGRADVLDLSANYALIRQRSQNFFLRLGAQAKNLTDELQAVNLTSDKRTQGLSVGWAWERRDDWLGGGYLASSGTLYAGRLTIRDETTRNADRSIFGRDTAGGFGKLGFQFSRLQAVAARQSLFFAVSGQLASKNLDPSEKVALGGARAVRAYPSGEVLVDQGVIGSIEWRWAATPELTPFVLYDAAQGRLVRDARATDLNNTRSLRGAGIGLTWSQPRNFSVAATLSWRTGTRPAVTDGGGRNPRLYVQLQKVF